MEEAQLPQFKLDKNSYEDASMPKTEQLRRIAGLEVTLNTSSFKTRNLFAEVIMKASDISSMAKIYLTSGRNGPGRFKYWNRGWNPSVNMSPISVMLTNVSRALAMCPSPIQV